MSVRRGWSAMGPDYVEMTQKKNFGSRYQYSFFV